MVNVKAVPANQVEPVGQLLEIKYLPLEAVQRWERNPKLHDIPKLVQPLARNGFQYPPKFDSISQAQAGNVRMLKGEWNRSYIDEMAAFPTGANDDQWDGTSGAFNKLHLVVAGILL